MRCSAYCNPGRWSSCNPGKGRYAKFYNSPGLYGGYRWFNANEQDIKDMQDQFRDFMGAFTDAFEGRTEGKDFAYGFPVDVQKNKEAYTISADVPGFSRDDITLKLSKARVLSISFERKKPEDAEQRQRRRYGKFRRSLKLPEDAQLEGVKATVEDGVLSITVPRTPTDSEEYVNIDFQ